MSESVVSSAAWKGAVVEANIASRAIKREEQPEDILGALIFLSSAESDFITGQVIVIDGGSVMH
jgi:NAD(P)-dependent dehydrogenase (short-subunit alcohol dehydrogenase family)